MLSADPLATELPWKTALGLRIGPSNPSGASCRGSRQTAMFVATSVQNKLGISQRQESARRQLQPTKTLQRDCNKLPQVLRQRMAGPFLNGVESAIRVRKPANRRTPVLAPVVANVSGRGRSSRLGQWDTAPLSHQPVESKGRAGKNRRGC